MAAIRERVKKDGTRVYAVQVRLAGYPAVSATFRTRRAAERWAKTKEAEMIEGRHSRSAEARRRTVAEAVDRYMLDVVPRKRDGGMHRAYLPHWKQALGAVKLADLTPALIAAERDKLARGTYTRAKPSSKRSTVPKGQQPKRYPRSPATVNRYLAVLGHVFTVARREWHWLSWNPLDGVARLPESKGRVRALSDAERAALLAETAADPVLHCFVTIALHTACRAGELTKLEWSDVDLKAGRVLFRDTKTATPRTAWIHGEALRLLKAHAKVRKIAGGAVFQNASGRGAYQYAKPFRAAVEAAGLANFKFHDLRHTAATLLAAGGATEQQLRAIGGWRSNIVARYVHLQAEDARAATERLAARLAERGDGDDE